MFFFSESVVTLTSIVTLTEKVLHALLLCLIIIIVYIVLGIGISFNCLEPTSTGYNVRPFLRAVTLIS